MNVLQKWEFTAKDNGFSVVIPDGCRDLLFWAAAGEKPYWQVTSLDDTAYSVNINAGDYLKGYRLQPGVSVDVRGLLSAVNPLNMQGDITDRVNEFTALSQDVQEALECIAISPTVRIAATSLGVSPRKLQRICVKTGRSPAAWLSMARARKAARAVLLGDLAQTAQDAGYADQAHMCREFNRWFGVSPLKLRARPDIVAQLRVKGYC
ncbi:MAG: helix-turn-helix domain-containing protein [Rhodobacteraceae bacterium]|nr:helix-turn-helix domain-containing protein [Paracoccaceae bacterium]